MDDTSSPAAVAFTPGSTVDELLKSAFFVADSIGVPVVSPISESQLNLFYPSDGSLAVIRVEARAGAWGGISPLPSTDEEKAAANQHFNDMLAASQPPVEVEPPA